eukprot:UN27068
MALIIAVCRNFLPANYIKYPLNEQDWLSYLKFLTVFLYLEQPNYWKEFLPYTLFLSREVAEHLENFEKDIFNNIYNKSQILKNYVNNTLRNECEEIYMIKFNMKNNIEKRQLGNNTQEKKIPESYKRALEGLRKLDKNGGW